MMRLVTSPVMAGLVPAIHVVKLNRQPAFDHAKRGSSQRRARGAAWMAGTSPAVTAYSLVA